MPQATCLLGLQPGNAQTILLSHRIELMPARIQGGVAGYPDPPPPPLENHKNIVGFLSNTGLDTLKNHKATKPAFNGEPPSARQRNAIYEPSSARQRTPIKWRLAGGPMMAMYLDPPSPHQLKNAVKLTKFLDPRMQQDYLLSI